ncbi:hypothetical protein VHUM_01502 [Vanrija humicola]|uniref:E3 ubiquitin-protein ligase listerin n=1 Tax=Vanrija humicola TaxID=5417 RepID=A0A7D8V836_VANHU|nr:hypothetical protein VHUM_01502 [Vanrija humicola]
MGAKGGRRGAPPVETEAKITAKAVSRVVTLSVGGTLTDPLLAEIKRTTLEACFPAEVDAKRPAFLARATAALTELRTASPQIETAVDEIILQIADGCTERLFSLVGERSPAAVPQAEGLVGILTRRKDLFPPERVHVLSQGLQAHLPELVDTLSPQLLASLLDAVAGTSSTSEADSLRTAVWGYVQSDAVERPKRFALAAGILGSGAAGLLSQNSLDAVALEASRGLLQDDGEVASSIVTAAVVSKGWLSDSARQDILASLCTTVQDAVDGLLTEGTTVELPVPSLKILEAYAKDHLDELVTSEVTIHGIVAVHHMAILLPRLEYSKGVYESAVEIWKTASGLKDSTKQLLSDAISASLAELLGRVSCRVDPGTLVDVALATDLGASPTPAEVAKALLPSSTELLKHLAQHTSQPPHPSLPVIDPLVPCVSETNEQVTRPSDFDVSGRSRAARYAEAGLALLREDRSLVQAFPSLLHVALSAMVLAEDGIAIPGASRGLYTVDTPVSQLGQVIRDAEGALSFSLAIVDEAPLAWHKTTVEQLRTGTVPDNADYLQRLLSSVRQDVVAKTSDVAPRIFREVLSRHLRQCDAGEVEGEVWLTYALQMSDRLPDIALAVILAIKPLMFDSKAFEMAQNRLANFLTGINVKQANEKGLPALRILIASAPPLDSTAIFLPQQRAVFALRHVGGWLTSEDEAADDLADEVDVRVAELYTAIAPIVQDLSGAHWDAMFDLVEGSLSSSSLDDPVSYPLLYAGLNLLKEIRDLCQTNKSLRELWTAKDEHFGLVVNLFLQCRDANSIPVQLIHSLILDLLRDASPAVMAQAGLSELCDLLRLSSSATIQATAYRLLGQVIRKQTAALVLEVEAAVAKEDEEQPQQQITIPQQLISIVEAGRAVDWFEMSDIEIVLGQLLAWMAVLDHFDDASRTVRWAYLDQINTSRLMEESLLPLLFAMLGVSEVGAWNFPATQYAVDEFYPDLLEPDELADLTPLASHVFYRTLVTIPSAMRSYYESLKDRQLSLSLVAFTAKNYSPVIIQHEFAALREPRALAALTEEGLNVRIAHGGGASVAGSGAAEAIASYVVDEQPMEIGIRLPAEFPLKAVDVRDLRRVGVPENKWRGWLMSVQQTITSRNGLILEALTVFKKNVVLHFEGVVECAICYSIISLTDRTLPTKPCRTCKNRFHASCLFKWFNSSHSSSCPMCRSLF